MMSEKQRFESVIDEDTMSVMPYFVCDKEEECFYNLQGCVGLLNKQQSEIEELQITIRLYDTDIIEKDNKIKQLQQQLDFIQNNISNAIQHQKTELEQKALKRVISDYNDWLLGHNGEYE